MIDSKEESFFLIDTETLGIDDRSVVLDLSTVFVDMESISKDFDGKSLLKFDEFMNSEYISTKTLFPDIKEQINNGSSYDKGTIDFWKGQYSDASPVYKEYISKLLSNEDKSPISEVVDDYEYFLSSCLGKVTKNSFNDVPFLERSGGFDTNKYYNLMKILGLNNIKSNMKYWSRREIRTIISCNRHRIPKRMVENNTSWSEEMVDKIISEYEDFTKHIAINDCLIDAYMIYLMKMTIENFYL